MKLEVRVVITNYPSDIVIEQKIKSSYQYVVGDNSLAFCHDLI